jgi:hypothetical protein
LSRDHLLNAASTPQALLAHALTADDSGHNVTEHKIDEVFIKVGETPTICDGALTSTVSARHPSHVSTGRECRNHVSRKLLRGWSMNIIQNPK